MVIWPKLTIEIFDTSGNTKYGNIDSEINSLRFSGKKGIGYDSCTFTIVRDVRFSHPDLKIMNVVKIWAGDRRAWEGLITSANIQMAEDTGLEITCQGYYELLRKRLYIQGIDRDIMIPLTAGMKGSDWIIGCLLTDTNLEFNEGNIDTNDYEFPIDLELGDEPYYSTILEKINEYNGYEMGVGEDRKFDFYPQPSTIAYKVRIEDCQTNLMYERGNIENRLYVIYTTDGGTTYNKVWWVEGAEDSIELYGWCDGVLRIEETCTPAMAQQKATVALQERKSMKPATDLTLERLYDINTGTEADPRLIKPSTSVFIENLGTLQTSIDNAAVLNDMSTFEITETEFEVESGQETAR